MWQRRMTILFSFFGWALFSSFCFFWRLRPRSIDLFAPFLFCILMLWYHLPVTHVFWVTRDLDQSATTSFPSDPQSFSIASMLLLLLSLPILHASVASIHLVKLILNYFHYSQLSSITSFGIVLKVAVPLWLFFFETVTYIWLCTCSFLVLFQGLVQCMFFWQAFFYRNHP